MREWPTPSVSYVTGSGAMNHVFAPPSAGPWRFAYARLHFGASGSAADLTLSVESAHGDEYDAQLDTQAGVGPGADVFFAPTTVDDRIPNAWTFQPGDGLRFRWNGSASWGLEIGFEEF